jgi:hypothetical protein
MRHCLNFDIRSRLGAYTLYEKFNSWIEYGEEFENVEWKIIQPKDESEFHSEAIYTIKT